ncbi:hypothetical protein BCD49_23195 [Pseudofrankia sp. EUN1h]|nr:hypothetical protein BCD49_23195 [Pseudofrankia sp. EUN1h]
MAASGVDEICSCLCGIQRAQSDRDGAVDMDKPASAWANGMTKCFYSAAKHEWLAVGDGGVDGGDDPIAASRADFVKTVQYWQDQSGVEEGTGAADPGGRARF